MRPAPKVRPVQSLPVIIGLLLGSAAVIYVACEYFINGVEWVGRKLAVGQKATGTILAAFGTAMPESVVTFVAVTFPHSAMDKDVGVGAAMGGPLVLGTIAYAIVGVTLWMCKRGLPSGEEGRRLYAGLSRDQAWFIVISIVKVAIGLVAFALKPWTGILFLAAYAAYAWKEMGGEQEIDDDALEPLKLSPKAPTPKAWTAILQTLAALGVIFAASRFFVGQLGALGPFLGLKPQLLSFAGQSGRHRVARDAERHHLDPSGQGAPGACQHQRGDDDPGDRADGLRRVRDALAARSGPRRGGRGHPGVSLRAVPRLLARLDHAGLAGPDGAVLSVFRRTDDCLPPISRRPSMSRGA